MSNKSELFYHKVPSLLEKNASLIEQISASYEFRLNSENQQVWSLQLTNGKHFITPGTTGNAECIVEMNFEHFEQMINGNLDPKTAFITGKLKIEGNMGTALNLETIFQ